ncbi:reprolysin-like metallopeptidase [Methylopila sp. M107]|uniref:reprolysin-like metallopeptidase n=1 Tax=Methylopila sp. M107 TaxID=1101190 RepID=UPI000379C2B2|nr:M12 family metallo-peptidase [Methylopila sp. M107]
MTFVFANPRAVAAALACLAATLFSAPAPADAQGVDLFRAVTPAEQGAAQDARPERAAKRSRLVALNVDALAPAGAAADAFKAPELKITLFPGVTAKVRRTDSEDAGDGSVVWNGEGDEDSATLVVDKGRITGLVTHKGKSYRITPAGDRAQRITEVDAAQIPPDGPLRPAPSRPQTKKSDAAPAADAAKSQIRVLVAYTQQAASSSSNIAADAKLGVALANKGYKASGVKIKLKLSSAIQVTGFSDSRGFDAALDEVTAGTGAFAGVAARRASDKADLVVLLIRNADYCGLGWYVENPSADYADLGFSVVAGDCITYHSVAHEIGHNMGLDHDRYVTDPAPNSEYNFGFVNVKKKKRDIMSYNNKCIDKGVDCARVNQFSNPKSQVSGQPFGVAAGKKGAADATRRLNETRAAIAAYR